MSGTPTQFENAEGNIVSLEKRERQAGPARSKNLRTHGSTLQAKAKPSHRKPGDLTLGHWQKHLARVVNPAKGARRR
jgi:hypothetical protein